MRNPRPNIYSRKPQKRPLCRNALLCFILLLNIAGELLADIKSTSGTIVFDSNSDGASEALLTSNGLAIGPNLTPSANLHIQGNTIISGNLYIGGSTGSANLNINGTMALSAETISDNTTLNANTLVLVNTSSANLEVILPDPQNTNGRLYQIKNISGGNVKVSSNDFLDNTYTYANISALGALSFIASNSKWYSIDSYNVDLVEQSVFATSSNWIPITGGIHSYDYHLNWGAFNIDNVFLPSDYSAGDQTILINSDSLWSSSDVISYHSNSTTLLIQAQGGDKNLSLGSDIFFVTSGTNNDNLFQFGTTNANEGINFSLSTDHYFHVDSSEAGDAKLVLNGVISGSGNLIKSGNSELYLQNSANSFTGNLIIEGGIVVLAGADASLSTNNIVIARQNRLFGYSLDKIGTQGVLMLGNNSSPVGTSSGTSGANNNRIPDTAIVELQGGCLRLEAHDGNTNSLTETVGTVNLTRGQGDLVVWQAQTGPNNITTLHVNNLNRTPGAVLGGFCNIWNGASGNGTLGLGADLEGRITLGTINSLPPSNSVVNDIIPWAVNGAQYGGVYWASTAPGDFLTYGSNGLVVQTSFASDMNTASSTENVKVTSSTVLTSTRTINSLTIYGGAVTGSAETLTLTSGAINIYSSNPLGGASALEPTINFNGQEALIFISNAWQVNINSDLTNTGGNGVTFTGYGFNATRSRSTVSLFTGSTYTGPTTINGVYLDAVNNSLPSTTAVTINEGGVLNTSWGNNPTVGSLAGYGIVEIDYDKTFFMGSDNTSTSFSGNIQEGPNATGSSALTKSGSGTFSFSGISSYGGLTTISEGTYVMNGTHSGSGNFNVSAGAILAGSGNIANGVAVSGGNIEPGSSSSIPGALSLGNTLNFNSSSTLRIDINSLVSHDALQISNGNIFLNGANLAIEDSSYSGSDGTVIIINNQTASSISGTFNGLAEGGNMSASKTWVISYLGGDGNDISLTPL